jgi:hypothetical protein
MGSFIAARLATALSLATVLLAFPSAAQAQAAVRVYGRDAIPLVADHGMLPPGTPFSSWSLFLPCNPRWLATERSEDLGRLNRAYFHFAIVTGPRHAAVWFLRPRAAGAPGDQPNAANDLDIERSAAYCDRFGLRPSGGPYVAVTTVHPDQWQGEVPGQRPADPLVVLAFDNIGSVQAAELLTELNDQLQRNQLSREALDTRRWWLAWDRVLGGMCRYFRDLKVSVSIKVVEIEKGSVCPA